MIAICKVWLSLCRLPSILVLTKWSLPSPLLSHCLSPPVVMMSTGYVGQPSAKEGIGHDGGPRLK